VAARVDQPAIIVLAVEFDERGGEFAQQAGAGGLVVDEAARGETAVAIRAELTAQQQGLAGFVGDAGLFQLAGDGSGKPGEFEAGVDAGLFLAGADQAGVRPHAEDEAQRIEQDRLAGAGLAGEHAEAGGERQVERLDQDDVADGEPGQHVRATF